MDPQQPTVAVLEKAPLGEVVFVWVLLSGAGCGSVGLLILALVGAWRDRRSDPGRSADALHEE